MNSNNQDLEREFLLEYVHKPFIEIMPPYFKLDKNPEPIEVELLNEPLTYGSTIIENGGLFVSDKNKIKLIECKLTDSYESRMRSKILTCAHESGHYLHSLKRPDFYKRRSDDNLWEYFRYREKFLEFRDVVAELGGLIFLSIACENISQFLLNDPFIEKIGKGIREQWTRHNPKSLVDLLEIMVEVKLNDLEREWRHKND